MQGPRLVSAGLCLFAAALPLSIAAANIGWVAAAAGLALCAWEKAPVDWKAWRGPLLWPLGAYLAAALVASLVAPDAAGALRSLHKDAHKLGLYALLSVAFTAGGTRKPLAALAGGAAAAAAVGLFQWTIGLADAAVVPRAHGWLHAVTYGEQMAVLFLGALAAWRLPSDLGPRARAAAAALSVLTGTALLLSNTRGALAAAAAGLFVAGSALPRLRRALFAAAAAAALVAVAADLLTPRRSLILTALGRGNAPAWSTQGQMARLTLWKAAVGIGLDHPVAGAGIGGYRVLLPSYVKSGTLFDGNERSWGTADNLYLHQFAERGFVGAAALAWLLFAYAAGALRRARRDPGALNLWSLGAAGAFLVMNLTEVAFQVELVWMLTLFVWTAAEAGTGRGIDTMKAPSAP
ncbi:MAG: O-antigen ligase family protein [Elusimicrobia bacterium]|nr:O-antigen ligase family protein [Elusimicrobiota bacterium]